MPSVDSALGAPASQQKVLDYAMSSTALYTFALYRTDGLAFKPVELEYRRRSYVDATVSRAPRRPMPSVDSALGAPASQQKVLDCLKISCNRPPLRNILTVVICANQSLCWSEAMNVDDTSHRPPVGFRLLGGCFEACKTNLKTESPLLTSEIFMGAFQQYSDCRNLCQPVAMLERGHECR
jgi:hypothetical protein